MIDIIKSIAWVVSFFLTIYASYFTVLSLFSLLPKKKGEKFEPKYKFAAIIAARNEELVIGNLIDSLQNQNYPKEMYDIIVIPNNCTDGTRQVAISKNVKVFDCKRVIKSKGDALSEYFDSVLKHDTYDAFCIFDADNVVSENFIAEMNNAMCQGVKVGQGYRDSKNPYDTYISSCYSIYYYMVNRFFNRARSALNLSAMVNGSGFVISADVLRNQGGWHTKTMTEDIEITTKCVLSGEKVQWVPDAVIYDEQPLTFEQSWKQRKRWSTGLIQGFQLYSAQLVKNTVSKKSMACFDLLMFFIAPYIQILYLVSILFTILLSLLYVGYNYFPQTDVFYRLFLSIDYSYIVSFLLAASVILIERKKISKMLKGVFSYWFFVMSWIPINIMCIFKKQTEWVPINHTRIVKIDDLVSEKN